MAPGRSNSSKRTNGKRTKGDAADDVAASSSRIHMPRLRLQSEQQQLLPGIPDEITLSHIITKLPWTDSQVLPSVSCSWNQAIQSRKVYDARVRSQSTETLVICGQAQAAQAVLAVYSMRGKRCYTLPPIPDVPRGIPYDCQCVSLDGRIYILGGRNQTGYSGAVAWVYVLDLIGQRKWRRCADMPQARMDFGCCVLDGKIYVLEYECYSVRESFVYDPKVNGWSQIAPTPSRYSGYNAAVVGGKLLNRPIRYWPHDVAVVAGELFLSVYPGISEGEGGMAGDYRLEMLVYNPIRNDWRDVETTAKDRECPYGRIFEANRKLYVLTGVGIHRHDTDKNIWAKVHSVLCAAIGPAEFVKIRPISVVVANGELLASVGWSRGDKKTSGFCLLQSTGFGDENYELVWKKVNCSPAFRRFGTAFMRPAQL